MLLSLLSTSNFPASFCRLVELSADSESQKLPSQSLSNLAHLRRSQVSVFIVPNRLRFRRMITTKSLALINLRKTRWSAKEWACALRVRRLSSRQLVIHAFRRQFAVFLLSSSESGLRIFKSIASIQAISSSSALMSFN